MTIAIGRFRLETFGRAGFYIRLPFIGAAHIGGGMTAFDSWASLRRTGEV